MAASPYQPVMVWWAWLTACRLVLLARQFQGLWYLYLWVYHVRPLLRARQDLLQSLVR
jgi:hypothetical protein